MYELRTVAAVGFARHLGAQEGGRYECDGLLPPGVMEETLTPCPHDQDDRGTARIEAASGSTPGRVRHPGARSKRWNGSTGVGACPFPPHIPSLLSWSASGIADPRIPIGGDISPCGSLAQGCVQVEDMLSHDEYAEKVRCGPRRARAALASSFHSHPWSPVR